MQPFVVAPAIDVLEGRCVRLAGGQRERVIVEGGAPEAAAERFAGEGAELLHLVDLDAAFGAEPSLALLTRIVSAGYGVPVQVGGGYRSVEQIEAALEAGATRVIVGTAAVSEDFLGAAADRFGSRLAVAVDVRDGRVVVEGWTQTAQLTPVELARRCGAVGLDTLLVTSTIRDGSLAGPDLELLAELVDASGLDVLAAGGIGTLEDLRAIRAQGCAGAVVGSAIWLGRFGLPQALAAVA